MARRPLPRPARRSTNSSVLVTNATPDVFGADALANVTAHEEERSRALRGGELERKVEGAPHAPRIPYGNPAVCLQTDGTHLHV